MVYPQLVSNNNIVAILLEQYVIVNIDHCNYDYTNGNCKTRLDKRVTNMILMVRQTEPASVDFFLKTQWKPNTSSWNASINDNHDSNKKTSITTNNENPCDQFSMPTTLFLYPEVTATPNPWGKKHEPTKLNRASSVFSTGIEIYIETTSFQ